MSGLDPLFIATFGLMVFVGLPLEYCRWRWHKANKDNLLALCACFIGNTLVVGALIWGDAIPTTIGRDIFLAIMAGIGSLFVIMILWEVFFNSKED